MAQFFEFIGNHPIAVGTFLLLLILFIRNETRRGGEGVTAQEAVNLVNNEDALVLDVRDPKEYSAGHIVGAINIPHQAVESRLNELEKFRNRPIVVACRMGQHAGGAGTVLRKAGLRAGNAPYRRHHGVAEPEPARSKRQSVSRARRRRGNTKHDRSTPAQSRTDLHQRRVVRVAEFTGGVHGTPGNRRLSSI